jgi:hypothetical protein
MATYASSRVAPHRERSHDCARPGAWLRRGLPQRVKLDIDSIEIPVYGQQENSAYDGQFESTCYHPLVLFSREGDCLSVKLWPGNVHSADD